MSNAAQLVQRIRDHSIPKVSVDDDAIPVPSPYKIMDNPIDIVSYGYVVIFFSLSYHYFL